MKTIRPIFAALYIAIGIATIHAADPSPTAKSPQDQTQKLAPAPWQSSWEKFLEKMEGLGVLPRFSFSDGFPASKDFVGKEIVWEGTLSDVKDVKTRAIILMPTSRMLKTTNSQTAGAGVVQLLMTPATFDKWKSLPKGAKVKFKATVPELFFIFAGGDNGPLMLFLNFDAGEAQ